jgi:hypothetical protein
MAGLARDDFAGNVYTAYGERYEARVRAIGRAVLGCRIDEWGMFRDRVRRHLAISPDGETNALRVLGTLDDGTCVDWTLGKLMWEIKTSRNHAYETPRIPHIAQLQLQLHVMGRHWGVLHYWSRDHTRAWLMRHDRFGFVLWMMRRLDLMHEHVVRRVPVVASNPFFAYRWHNGRRMQTVADFLQAEWYDVAAAGAPLRPRLTAAQWCDELAALGMTPAEWDARYPDTAWSPLDAGTLALPPRPEMYLIYEYQRAVPADEAEWDDDRTVVDHDEADGAWFAAAFPPVAEWAAAQRDPRPPSDVLPPRMCRLLIDEVLAAPQHDEEPPTDARADDTPDERAAYEARLAALLAADVPPPPRPVVQMDIGTFFGPKRRADDEAPVPAAKRVVPETLWED